MATCVQCGDDFPTPVWPNVKQIHCSRKCRYAYYRARNRERLNADSRQWCKDNPDTRRAVCKKYSQSAKGKETARRGFARNRERLAAQKRELYNSSSEYRAIHRAREISHKNLLKHCPRVCAFCDKTNRVQCHHRDLNPLNTDLNNLMWLCHWCHKALHAEIEHSIRDSRHALPTS